MTGRQFRAELVCERTERHRSRDSRGSTIGHFSARRLAVGLAARLQEPEFAQNLARFADNNGMISPRLKMQLRWRARSAAYTDRSQVVRMLEYCIDLGPISRDCGATCDQIDQAHTMRARLHDEPLHDTREALPDWLSTRAFRCPAHAAARKIELENASN
jgi:hypothetical protein